MAPGWTELAAAHQVFDLIRGNPDLSKRVFELRDGDRRTWRETLALIEASPIAP
jgi:hypothetical protein